MNPYLIRKIIYPAYRAFKRDDVLRNLSEMHRVQTLPPEEIRAYQWAKLKRLLEHAAGRVPYYRRLFNKIGAEPGDFKSLDDLKSLPLLRKSDIRNNLEDLIAEGYPRGRLKRDETGGSTGVNLSFYIDRASMRARQACLVRMDEWLDIGIGDRTAMLWGIRFRGKKSNRLKVAVRNWLTNIHIMSIYEMDADSVAGYVRKLRRLRPKVIVGYPSALSHMAQVILDAGLEPPRPSVIMASGETGFDWQYSIIEQTFGAKVYNHYGSCEFGPVARECRYGQGLHLACERFVAEIVPMGGPARPGGPGQESPGELVITDLDNIGMPFIRYAIEDYGTLSWGQCECGLTLPVIGNVIGRTTDIVKAPNGNYLGGTFWGHLLKEGVRRFQVIQDEIDRVKITLIADSDFTDEVRQEALARIRRACGEEMRVEFEIVDSIPATKSGKHRYVISKVNPVDHGT
jgi:phenylacetate-CoA ligase